MEEVASLEFLNFMHTWQDIAFEDVAYMRTVHGHLTYYKNKSRTNPKSRDI